MTTAKIKVVTVYDEKGTVLRVMSEDEYGKDFEAKAKMLAGKKEGRVVKAGRPDEAPVEPEEDAPEDAPEEEEGLDQPEGEEDSKEEEEGTEDDSKDEDEDEDEDEEEDEEEIELDDLSVKELREVAKEKKVNVKGMKSRKDIVAAIEESEEKKK